MPFSFRTVYEYQKDSSNACRPNTNHVLFRLADVFLRTWDLGFTAFGGPPVHFQILHQRFVESRAGHAAWVDEQTVSLMGTTGESKENCADKMCSSSIMNSLLFRKHCLGRQVRSCCTVLSCIMLV